MAAFRRPLGAYARAVVGYAAPAIAAYWLIVVGTAVAAAALYALGPAFAWLGGFAAGLVSFVSCACSQPPGPTALWANHMVHYVATAIALSAVAGAAGWLVGRLSPRRPRMAAWAVGLVVVMDGALTLALPPARPEWVAVLRPFLRVPATWYLPTMWYQLEPLLDAARLALLIPAVVGGAGLGAARRAPEASSVSPAA
jgi:hypothetical protein